VGVSRPLQTGEMVTQYRTNLAVASKRTSDIFMAFGKNFKTLPTPTGLGLCDVQQTQTIECPHPPNPHAVGYIDPYNVRSINPVTKVAIHDK
jgi:hypothetical protein